MHAAVAVHRKAQAAIDGDAIVDAQAARVRHRMLDRKPALQVNVVVHQRIVLSAKPEDVAVEFVHFGPFVRDLCDVLGQWSDPNVLEVRGARWVVPLERERAVIEDALEIEIGPKRRIRFHIVHHQHVVQPDLHLLSAYQDVHPEPLIVVNELLIHVADPVERARLLLFHVSVRAHASICYLHLESRRGPA